MEYNGDIIMINNNGTPWNIFALDSMSNRISSLNLGITFKLQNSLKNCMVMYEMFHFTF